jgi:hypothetical protein
VTSAHPKDSTILASVAQAAFVRDIATDANTWSDHASAVFADIAPALLASGAGFQGRLSRMIEPTPVHPLRRTGSFATSAAATLPDRIWREELDVRARALD